MEAVRRADPNYVGYRSKSAVDAVERFRRMQRNGLPPTMIPEALIKCAKGLSEHELDLFTTWIICPNDVHGIDVSVIGAENLLTHQEMVREHQLKTGGNVKSQDDEKNECGVLATLVEAPEE